MQAVSDLGTGAGVERGAQAKHLGVVLDPSLFPARAHPVVVTCVLAAGLDLQPKAPITVPITNCRPTICVDLPLRP